MEQVFRITHDRQRHNQVQINSNTIEPFDSTENCMLAGEPNLAVPLIIPDAQIPRHQPVVSLSLNTVAVTTKCIG